MRSHSKVVAPALVVTFLILPLGATAAFAQWSAPGTPIFDCNDAAARYEGMEGRLALQEREIRHTEARLAALDSANAATDQEARDALVARSVDTVRSHAFDELAALADAKAKAMALSSRTASQLKWIEKVSALEKEISALKKLADAFQAGRDYGAIQSRSRSVAEHLNEANKLFVNSGLAEEIGGKLAGMGGPVGVLAFETSLFLLDYLVAEEESFITEREKNDLKGLLSDQKEGYDKVVLKMASLKRDCPAEFGEDASTSTPEIASTSHLTPPPPEPPSPPAEEGLEVSTGEESADGPDVALVAAGAGVAVAGGLYAGKVLSDMATMTDSGGTCASTRFCIVNSMSPGCSCSGSTSGDCSWSGPTAGGGDSCGAGMPCASGLSCNNGRCEGPSGRCPF